MATIAKALAPPPVRSVDVTSGSDPFLTLRRREGGPSPLSRDLSYPVEVLVLQKTGSWSMGRG